MCYARIGSNLASKCYIGIEGTKSLAYYNRELFTCVKRFVLLAFGRIFLCAMTLSIMTFNIKTLSIKGLYVALSINDTEHN